MCSFLRCDINMTTNIQYVNIVLLDTLNKKGYPFLFFLAQVLSSYFSIHFSFDYSLKLSMRHA